MKKSLLKEAFDRLTKAFPEATSLVCYTEAVFMTNPSPSQIRKGFYRWVDKQDYDTLKANEVLRDTFTDLLDGSRTQEQERMSLDTLE